ncbi:hypothetical protein HYY75_02540 [bacterium]|nr:hypothetical protein [bacterium]
MRYRIFYGILFLGLLGNFLFCTGCGGNSPKKQAVSSAPSLKIETFSSKEGLPSDYVTGLAYFGGQIWVGTKSGIARYDGVNWQIHVRKNTNALGSDLVEDMVVAENAVWIATDNGATKFDGKTWSSAFTGGRARSVSAKGTVIVVGTAHGIEQSTGGAFTTYGKEGAGLVYEEVNAVSFDAQGQLWVGTRAGMAKLNGTTFQNFTGPAKSVVGNSLVDVPPNPPNCQLIGNNINKIAPYKGKLAIGTTSGLSITDMMNQWNSYTSAHKDWVQRGATIVEEEIAGNSSMPGNSVAALMVAPNDSALFVGTNKGLAILADEKWIDLQGKLGDLGSKAVTSLALDGNVLWAGTPSGLFKVTGIDQFLPAPSPSK